MADIWDALRSDRPYRRGWPEDGVREHIRSLAGTHLDPEVVEVFIRILPAGGEPRDGLSEAADDTGPASSEWMGTPLPAARSETLEERLRRATEENGHLEHQREELGRIIAGLTELTTTDDLTGLKNRRHFGEALESAFSFAVRQDKALSLVMLDVDRFKLYNDTHGRPAGDRVLRLVAALLRAQLRTHDVVARYGGEGFAILLPATDADEGRAVAERLRGAVAEYEWPLRPVTVSLGVTTTSPAILESIQLVEEADGALYHSRSTGRDRVTHFQDLGPAPSSRRGRVAKHWPYSSPATV